MKRTLVPLPILVVVLSLTACTLGVTPPQQASSPPPPADATAPPIVAPTTSAAPEDTCQAGEMGGESPLYGHQIYLTTSADGRTFDEGQLILEHASVPDLTIGPDGALWVYFVNGEPGHHGIFASPWPLHRARLAWLRAIAHSCHDWPHPCAGLSCAVA